MHLNNHTTIKLIILAAITAMLFVPAIPQDIRYHNFSDQRSILSVSYFFNVISNAPFLLIGIAGIYSLLAKSQLNIIHSIRHVYITFFAGVALVCFGSGYYHLNPSNNTLLWDRLPMAIAFMAFFTIVIAEYVSENLARKIFLPLLLAGLASVIYWHWTETLQQGDLRPYILVQFLPMILIPFILLMYPVRYTHARHYWLIIVCYVLAKLLELGDAVVFENLEVISGHSLKHLMSALAPFVLYLSVSKRKKINTPSPAGGRGIIRSNDET